MPWDFVVILVFLGTVVPWVGRRRVRQLLRLPSTTRLERLSLYASTIAFQWLAAALILWRSAHYRIEASRLGLAIPQPVLTCAIAIGLSILLFLNQIVSLRRLVARPQDVPQLIPHLATKIFPQDSLERLAFLALVLTVAPCEELIYRGFVQFVLLDLAGGSLAAAVLGSSAFFALAHLYQEKRGVASTFFVGILFSIVRAISDSLIPTILAHFVADITIGFLLPARVAETRRLHATDAAKGVGPIFAS